MNYYEQSKQTLDSLKDKRGVRILALETSCDETAAAVIEDGRKIISNVVHTQIDLHAVYGGVVPEIASRAHVMTVDAVINAALEKAGMNASELDACAVTYGPGLVGALLTGVTAMKAYAYAINKPLIPVHHISGHICANYLTFPELEPPYICLVVSGGHSHLIRVEAYGKYVLLGQTQDDAAGEALDKAARVLHLPYPGGPLLDKLARTGDKHYMKLPQPKIDGEYDFSFSGLKTAFINAAHKLEQAGETPRDADMAASFVDAVVSQLAGKAVLALKDTGTHKLALAGGVSANSQLRERMTAEAEKHGFKLYMPRLDLCTDNAAMIGSAAYYAMQNGACAELSLNAVPYLPLV